MGFEDQLKQLREVYAERGDGELLALYETREDLTDVAQQALTEALREREILPVKDEAPERGSVVEFAADEGGLPRDETGLWRFDDALDAQRAISFMEEAGIAFRMVDQSRIDGRETLRGGLRIIRLLMVVKIQDAGKAKALLQDRMGLFPAAEGDDEAGHLRQLDDLMTVGMFAPADALLAAKELGAARISFFWRDSSDEPSMEGEWDGVALEVQRENLERAMAICEPYAGAA